MIKSAAFDIKDVIVYEGLGTFGTDIFIGKMPDSPHNAICLYDSSSGAPSPKFIIDQPAVQVRVRNSSYSDGWAKIKAVCDVLNGRGTEIINDTLYSGFWAMNDPQFLQYDEQDRAIFVLTLKIIREPANLSKRRTLRVSDPTHLALVDQHGLDAAVEYDEEIGVYLGDTVPDSDP